MAGLFAAASLLAQPPGGPGRGGRMGFGPGMGGPGGPMGFDMRATVTGAPFSGEEVTTEQQTLANGNVIQRQNNVKVYRDSQGRVRTEETMVRPAAPGSTATGTTTRTMIRIFDPVAGTSSDVDTQNKVVHQMAIRRASGNATVRGMNGNGGRHNMARATATQDPNVKVEDLGTQNINGILATGTRVTRTIPAGTIGNAMPIQTVHERWVSTDLQIPIMEKTTDPRFGTTVRQLTNVSRSEPDAGLFQAPAGYTVQTGGRGRGPRGGGQIR